MFEVAPNSDAPGARGRRYLDLNSMGHGESAVHAALEHAAQTVFYAPMACIM